MKGKRKYSRQYRRNFLTKNFGMSSKGFNLSKEDSFFKIRFKNTDIGHLIWGKVPGSRIWPGIIIHYSDCNMAPPKDHNVLLFWFGDNRISLAILSKTYPFIENFNKFYSKSGSMTYQRGIHEILKECCNRSKLCKNANPDNFNLSNLLQWARSGFGCSWKPGKIFWPKEGELIPENVKKYLELIKKAQLSDENEDSKHLDEFPMMSSSSDSDSDSDERRVWRSKAILLKEVRTGKRFLDSICIACEKGEENPVVSQHTFFEGGLCQSCKNTSDDIHQASEDDVFCAICCSPGEVLVCDNFHCDKIYCLGCIELFVAPSAVEKIKETDPWFCFLCTPFDPVTHGLLMPRPEWKPMPIERRETLENSDSEEDFFEEVLFYEETNEKRSLRVLSLFDGIATGLYVLDKLNINVEAYFASEIDENAMNVSKLHFGSRITYIGDIEKWSDAKVKSICPIDLLIGGSPCNDLSNVNPLRKGLFDPKGTGILFFQFFRIQKLIQLFNNGRYLFWLFENVASMPKEYKAYINQFLQRKPMVIDAKQFSSQKRVRFYWGNIPNMYNPISPKNEEPSQHCLGNDLYSECDRVATVDKVNCITTNPNSLRVNGGFDYPVVMNGIPDVPWVIEIEKIFGFPAHYTDVGNLSIRERQILLGKSWSVPVITHILTPLQKKFICNDSDCESKENKKDDTSE